MDEISQTLYDELHRLAASYMRNEHGARSFSTSDLVHEALERGLRHSALSSIPREEILRRIARLSREVLVDRARARAALRRGGGARPVQLVVDPPSASGLPLADVLSIDEALTHLSTLDERQARMVELRYFGGCTVEEVAGVLEVSTSTVEKEERKARSWIRVRLTDRRED